MTDREKLLGWAAQAKAGAAPKPSAPKAAPGPTAPAQTKRTDTSDPAANRAALKSWAQQAKQSKQTSPAAGRSTAFSAPAVTGTDQTAKPAASWGSLPSAQLPSLSQRMGLGADPVLNPMSVRMAQRDPEQAKRLKGYVERITTPSPEEQAAQNVLNAKGMVPGQANLSVELGSYGKVPASLSVYQQERKKLDAAKDMTPPQRQQAKSALDASLWSSIAQSEDFKHWDGAGWAQPGDEDYGLSDFWGHHNVHLDPGGEFATDDEERLYRYLVYKANSDPSWRGVEELSPYAFREWWDQNIGQPRAGQKRAEEAKEGGFWPTLGLAVSSGFDQFARGSEKALFPFMDVDTSTPTQYAAGERRKDLDGIAGIGFDAVRTVSNMAPSIALGTATGSTNLGLVTMAGSAGGGAMAGAQEEGYDTLPSAGYGVLTALSEAALGKALGGITALGGKALGTTGLLNNAISNIGNAKLRFLTGMASNTAGEALEEYLQDVLDPVFRNIALGEHNKFDPFDPDAAYSALMAAITTPGIEGTTAAINKAGNVVLTRQQETRVGQLLRESNGKDITNTLVLYGALFPPETDTAKIATTLAGRMESGKTVSDRDLGRLYNTMTQDLKSEADATKTEGGAPTDDVTVAEKSAAKFAPEMDVDADVEPAAHVEPADGPVADTMPQTEREVIARYAQTSETLGEMGREVIGTLFEDGQDGETYVTHMRAVYQTGRDGQRLDNLEPGAVRGLTDDQVLAAYTAGQADAELDLRRRGVVQGETANSQALGNLDGEQVAPVVDEKPGIDYDDAFTKDWVKNHMDQETAHRVDVLARKLGVRVQWVVRGGILVSGTDKMANADFSGTLVRIEADNPNPELFLAGHEFTHRLQQLDSDAYMDFRDFVESQVKGTTAVADMMKAYDGVKGFTEDMALDEVAANYAGRLLEGGEVLDRFIAQHSGQKRTVLQRLRDWVRSILDKLTGKDRTNAKIAEQKLTAALEAGARRVTEVTEEQGAKQKSTVGQVADGGISYSVKTVGARKVVWLEKTGLTNKQLDNHIAVAEYIAEHIGEVYTIIESGQKVYIGPDLPSEYTHSKYTAYLQKMKPGTARAKNRAVDGLGELIETATNRRWEKTKHAKNKDAKYGMYRYDSTFAFPVRDGKGGITRIRAYDVELLIRNATDGKKYLYDIVNIKENTTAEVDLQQKEDRLAAHEAAARSGVPDNSVPQDRPKSNPQNQGDQSRHSIAGSERVGPTYAEMVEEYGAIKPGENPAREIAVPKRTAKDKKVSQTVRTILEAEVTPDVAVPSLEELTANGDFSYEVYTDKAAIERAKQTIQYKGWGTSLAEWFKDVQSGTVSKDNTALGWALYNNAVNRKDTQTAMDIINAMIRHQRNAGQAIQATRILKKMSPETQLYAAQRSVLDLQEELNRRYGDEKSPKLKIPEDLAEDFMTAETQDERDRVLHEIGRAIGRQVPSTLGDKWNAWRYLAMLGNPKTHIRNIVGNAGFMPVVAAKDLTATAIEAVVGRVSGGRLERTKGAVGLGTGGRALLKAAWGDYANVRAQALGERKYSDRAVMDKDVEAGRRIFKSRVLEGARRGNGALMDLEDAWFSQPHYAYALAQFCKANGITAEDLAAGGPARLAKARAYAVREAQKATYRDTNAFSQWVSSIGRPGKDANVVKKTIGVAMEGVLPFRKTPANILARGVEYSPIGLVKSLGVDLARVARGKMTGAEAIDHISAGLTGTGLMMLGVFLAAQGLVRGGGGDDDKKKEFEELQGHQDYALEVGGMSVTLDWLAPEALPFFIGVNLYEQTQGDWEDVKMEDLLRAAGSVTEPLLEMSCLQSLNDLVETVQYGDTDGVVSMAASAATSYLTQALPTLLGQIERSGEGERMSTYTDKNKFITTDMQYAIGRASAKIPGLDYGQIPYIDAWGRTEDTGSLPERIVNNFINPAYTDQVDTRAMENELLRLYEATGDGGVFPSRVSKYFNVNGKRKDLTAEEYVKYATVAGTEARRLVTELTASREYREMDNDERVHAVEYAYQLAKKTGQGAVAEVDEDSWMTKAREAKKKYDIDEDTYISLKAKTRGIEGLKDQDGETIANSKGLQIMEVVYDAPGLNDKKRQAMFEYLGVGKNVRHYNKGKVHEELDKMRKR